jgi:hypothetical protein
MEIGERSENCLNCGEHQAVITKSQQAKNRSINCVIIDYWGEVENEWYRHRFTWTKRDQRELEAEEEWLSNHLNKNQKMLKRGDTFYLKRRPKPEFMDLWGKKLTVAIVWGDNKKVTPYGVFGRIDVEDCQEYPALKAWIYHNFSRYLNKNQTN